MITCVIAFLYGRHLVLGGGMCLCFLLLLGDDIPVAGGSCIMVHVEYRITAWSGYLADLVG